MRSPLEHIQHIFLLGGAGVLVCVWLALIALEPKETPDYLAKGLFLLVALPTFIFTAIVLSEWLTYFRNR